MRDITKPPATLALYPAVTPALRRQPGWLARNAIRASLCAAVVALSAPVVFLALLAAHFHWVLASEPSVWVAWLPGIAAAAGVLLTAGYFLVTAALFQATARQALAAAEQAYSAATSAEIAIEAALLHRRAVQGTIATQDLERRRLFQPLRNAVVDRIAALEKIMRMIKGEEELTRNGIEGLWSERIQQAWDIAEGVLLPEVRDDLIDVRERSKMLVEELSNICRITFRRKKHLARAETRLAASVSAALERLERINALIGTVHGNDGSGK